MFTLMKNLHTWVHQKQERSAAFVLVGLDNAGKTTVVKALQGQVVRETRPTVGFQRGNQYKTGKYMLKMHDLGGGAKIRGLWDSYYAEVHGVVFVVDAADEERLELAREMLDKVMKDERIEGKPILIFANKQDLPGALGAAELSEKLGLSHAHGSHSIVPCQALPAEGSEEIDTRLADGMKWILTSATNQWKNLSARVERQCAERDEIERVKREEKKARVAKMKAERAAAAAKAEAEAAERGEVIGEPEPKPHQWSENAGGGDIEAGLPSAAPAAASAAESVGAASEAGSKPSSPGKEGSSQEVLPGQIAMEPACESPGKPAGQDALPPGQLPPLRGTPPRLPTPEPQP
jgi:ADP-ribosylation factor-like protein 13B